MSELKLLFKKNNKKMKKDENILGSKLEEIYNSAVDSATKKFERLQEVGDSKLSSDVVQKILDDVDETFSKEMLKMVSLIQNSMSENYDFGLEETSKILNSMS